jgi:xanthine dehydrogenase accessory factor
MIIVMVGDAKLQLPRGEAASIRVPAGEARTPAVTAIDPVCRMSVAAVETTLHSDIGGQRHWFCAKGCRAAFEAAPAHDG